MADLAHAETGNAEGYHHECDLGDGGEGEYALDVKLRAGDYCGIESRGGTDDGYECGC